jgi:hypothetical protein
VFTGRIEAIPCTGVPKNQKAAFVFLQLRMSLASLSVIYGSLDFCAAFAAFDILGCFVYTNLFL